MQRVSDFFGLRGSQGSFDFIDVNVEGDTPLVIDPAAIAHLDSDWAASCTTGIQTLFQRVLDYVKGGNRAAAESLMSYLGEDNSTHLGYSSTSRGSGVGSELASRFYDELAGSVAVRSGLIAGLEDTALLIEGVGEDRISDVVTNIVRRQRIEFTGDAATYYGIPLSPGINLGHEWNHHELAWEQNERELPVTPAEPLLLVPKSIVRRSLFFNPSEYYRYYVLEYFKARELQTAHSPLVQVLQSGERRVKKGDVERKYREKHLRNRSSRPCCSAGRRSRARGGTRERNLIRASRRGPLDCTLLPRPREPGRRHELHDGRKRIDLTYMITARLRHLLPMVGHTSPCGEYHNRVQGLH